jgi:hypothetical protein
MTTRKKWSDEASIRVDCPTCGALVGHYCTTKSGKLYNKPHHARVHAWIKVRNVDAPVPDAKRYALAMTLLRMADAALDPDNLDVSPGAVRDEIQRFLRWKGGGE